MATSAPAHGRIIQSAFKPHPLLRNPHLQTLSFLARPTPPVEYTRERWERPDGDFIDLGHCGNGSGPRVILLHGLTGGFDSKYLLGMARQLVNAGWRCVFMQFRGAGEEPNRLPRGYHQGDTADLRGLARRLRDEEPDTPLFAVGWSLGGNVLLKYLGEEGNAAPLAAAVAVSVPFQLKPCAERLRTGFSRVYQRHLLGQLKAHLRKKAAAMEMPIDVGAGLAARDFFEWDDAVVAPLNGFRDALDYYARCSSGRFLRDVARPTLVIHGADDPFMTPDVIPAASELSAAVELEVCERGGHVGFVAADSAGRPYRWLEERIPEFLEDHARALRE